MQNNFNRALSAGLLFTALMGLSQPASFAGFGNLFGGGSSDSSSSSSGSSSKTNVNSSNPTANGDENTFVPPGAQGQIVDPDPQTPLIKDKKKVKDTTGAPPANGDFTADEKVMQNRFRQRIANAHKNIDKGEKMMLSCGNDHNKAEYKKGKVMKEIGEKDLAALKENSPFPSNSSLDPDRPAKAKKPDSL
jgi:hypothetical protein